jgi:hypothetical protein
MAMQARTKVVVIGGLEVFGLNEPEQPRPSTQ